NALHAFCGIETIELPLRSSHKKSVFEPRPAPSHQHYGKAFIMRLPCIIRRKMRSVPIEICEDCPPLKFVRSVPIEIWRAVPL
ncbi:MAG: hypothetical protein SPE59_11725, partial [Treponema sp.]|nr:hypothetical protein [Treponema sp.]